MSKRKKTSAAGELAVIRTDDSGRCVFCGADTDDELKLGKFYSLGSLNIHHFCVLLSTCMVQNGKDDEGLLGFLLEDICVELNRAKRLRCSFCKKMGATLQCATAHCMSRFHLPCGIKHKCLSLFYNKFFSFCPKHRPKQKRPTKLSPPVTIEHTNDEIKTPESPTDPPPAENKISEIIVIDLNTPEPMDSQNEEVAAITADDNTDDNLAHVKAECSPILSKSKRKSFYTASSILTAIQTRRRHYNRAPSNANKSPGGSPVSKGSLVCPICMETVVAEVSPDTLWPPCCGNAGDRWFHRECIDRLALSAGQHYLKCPLCNDKSTFCNCMRRMGIYIPDQDASWEAADTNWFESLYMRHDTCDAPKCPKPKGPHSTQKKNAWELLLCSACAAYGCHRRCLMPQLAVGADFTCNTCYVAQHRTDNNESGSSAVDHSNIWQDSINPQINFMYGPSENVFTRRMNPVWKRCFCKTKRSMSSRGVYSKRRRIPAIHLEAMSNLSQLSVHMERCDSVISLSSEHSDNVPLSSDDKSPEKSDVVSVSSQDMMASQVHTISSSNSVMQTVLDDIIELSSCHTILSSSEDSYSSPPHVTSTSADPSVATACLSSQPKWLDSKGNFKLFMPTQKFKRKNVRHKARPHKQTVPSSTDLMRQLFITDYYSMEPENPMPQTQF